MKGWTTGNNSWKTMKRTPLFVSLFSTKIGLSTSVKFIKCSLNISFFSGCLMAIFMCINLKETLICWSPMMTYCSYNSKTGIKSIKSVPRKTTTKNCQKKFHRFIWRSERLWQKPTVMPRKRTFLNNQIKIIRFLIVLKSDPDFIKWTLMKYFIFWL